MIGVGFVRRLSERRDAVLRGMEKMANPWVVLPIFERLRLQGMEAGMDSESNRLAATNLSVPMLVPRWWELTDSGLYGVPGCQIHSAGFGREWVMHWPAVVEEPVEPSSGDSAVMSLGEKRVGARSKSFWRTNLVPVLFAGVGGLMIGSLFWLVAAAAVMMGSWAYAITFGGVGTMIVVGPVSLVFTYLWLDRSDAMKCSRAAG